MVRELPHLVYLIRLLLGFYHSYLEVKAIVAKEDCHGQQDRGKMIKNLKDKVMNDLDITKPVIKG